MPETTLARSSTAGSSPLLNHGYKAKIQRSKKNSALKDKTDVQGPSDFCEAQESESATLRLLFRRRPRRWVGQHETAPWREGRKPP